MSSVYIGIDPDLRCIVAAAIDAYDGKPLGLNIVRIKKSERGSRLRPDPVIPAVKGCQGIVQDLLKRLGHPNVAGAAVEGQEVVSSARRGANPGDILKLGQVAGALASECLYETRNVLLPAPAHWKGQVPKDVHHRRLCSGFGWSYENRAGYVEPIGHDLLVVEGCKMNSGDWKHGMDSFGLAKWSRDKHRGTA